jgi:soluble lytic murein transglycosylase-like protein
MDRVDRAVAAWLWLVGGPVSLCPNNHSYDAVFAAAGAAYGVDPALVKAHAAIESAFNPRAYRAEPRIGDASYGLMQLLYATASQYSNVEEPTSADQAALSGLYAPGVNIPLGARVIADNLARASGDVEVAIAAYNEGIGRALADRSSGTPWRTFDPQYVAKVKQCWDAYRGDFAGGPPAPDTPAAAGGSPGLKALGLALLTFLGILVAKKWGGR